MTKKSISEITATMAAPDAQMVKRLLDQGMMIPAQPRVLEELRQKMVRQEFDVRVLSRIINSDPGMVAMLFKTCGSPAYKSFQPFTAVDQILQAVGIRQTFNLLQGIAVASLQDAKINREAYEAFWARSQAVGQLAMIVADERVAVCNLFPDQAYLAGMFHDCGVALLMRRFPIYCKEMRLDQPGRWIDLSEEDKKFSSDHCVVGYLVARHWNLPDFICEAIRNHHDITRLGASESRSMVAIIQMAIHLYYTDQHVENTEWPRVVEDVMSELGLDEETFADFSDAVLERFHQAEV